MTTLSKDEVLRLAGEAGYYKSVAEHDFRLLAKFATLCRADLVEERDELKAAVARHDNSYEVMQRLHDEDRADFEAVTRNNKELLDQRFDLMEQVAKLKHHLSNLLARIHRDGGYYEAEHGLDKAVNDADLLVAHSNMEYDELKAKLAAYEQDGLAQQHGKLAQHCTMLENKLAAYESRESKKPQAWLWQYADGDWHDQPFDTLANCEREFAEFEGQAHPLFTAPEVK